MKQLLHYKTTLFAFTLITTMALLFVSCGKDSDDEPNYSAADLVGKWQTGSEFWRYDSGGSGITWDTADGVFEDDETTMRFTWRLDGDQLQHTFSGDEVHQNVVQDYTILELTNTRLRWNNGLKDVTLTKVSE